jgi:hypothetical protein
VSRATPPDVDRILEAIRAEAQARGSRGHAGGYSRDLGEGGGRFARLHGVVAPEPRHAADLLSLPLDVFIATAYRQLLGREPDAAGASHYMRMMLRGSMVRAEVMGRLALSAEGRRRGAPLPGVTIAFACALAYRIPVLGPLAGLAARALRLPPHWQDRYGIEHSALAAGTWMKR